MQRDAHLYRHHSLIDYTHFLSLCMHIICTNAIIRIFINILQFSLFDCFILNEHAMRLYLSLHLSRTTWCAVCVCINSNDFTNTVDAAAGGCILQIEIFLLLSRSPSFYISNLLNRIACRNFILSIWRERKHQTKLCSLLVYSWRQRKQVT